MHHVRFNECSLHALSHYCRPRSQPMSLTIIIQFSRTSSLSKRTRKHHSLEILFSNHWRTNASRRNIVVRFELSRIIVLKKADLFQKPRGCLRIPLHRCKVNVCDPKTSRVSVSPTKSKNVSEMSKTKVIVNKVLTIQNCPVGLNRANSECLDDRNIDMCLIYLLQPKYPFTRTLSSNMASFNAPR